MQDGLSTDTTHSPAVHVVRAVGEQAVLLLTRALKAETGLDLRSTGRTLLTGNRGHQRTGSTSSRRAALAEPADRGNDIESLAQGGEVDPMARTGGSISGVPDGTGSDSECSAADGRERRPHRRGETRHDSPSSEARAYSAVARIDTHLSASATQLR